MESIDRHGGTCTVRVNISKYSEVAKLTVLSHLYSILSGAFLSNGSYETSARLDFTGNTLIVDLVMREREELLRDLGKVFCYGRRYDSRVAKEKASS